MSDLSELKSPQEHFDGDHLPDDLKWIITHFGLPKNDPIVVLFAWHWHRVQHTTDAIQTANHELRAMLDMRVQKIQAHTERLDSIDGNLEQLAEILAQSPLGVSRQIEQELKIPIGESVAACRKLTDDLFQFIKTVEARTRNLNVRHLTACCLGGFSAGSLLTLWIFVHLFLR